MRIILDIMSGDKAPLETLMGAVGAGVAARDYEEEINFTLVGDENIIKKLAKDNNLDISGFEIRHTDVVLTMEDDPMAVMKEKKDSSLAIGLQMLANGEGDAFVSCGNTGALFCGSSLIVKRVKGVQRAAIGAILPLAKPLMLMDSGASVKVNEDYLHMFAIMGSAYMRAMYGIDEPKVALVNNGAEEHKGSTLYKEAHQLLKQAPINFVGNMEGRDVMSGAADVVVCDGFTGNVMLKVIEGVSSTLLKNVKGAMMSSLKTKIGALLAKDAFKALKKKMDYSEHGGALLLGTKYPVIKGHGSSDAKAVFSAIRQAVKIVEADVVCKIAADIEKMEMPEA